MNSKWIGLLAVILGGSIILIFTNKMLRTPQRILTLGHDFSEDCKQIEQLKKFAELLEQKSNQTLKIELRYYKKHGLTEELISAVKSQELDLILSSTQVMSRQFPDLNLFDLPFLFNDSQIQAVSAHQ